MSRRTYTYYDFGRGKNPIHLVRSGTPRSMCGAPLSATARGISGDEARTQLCVGCRRNYLGQGQGYEELPE